MFVILEMNINHIRKFRTQISKLYVKNADVCLFTSFLSCIISKNNTDLLLCDLPTNIYLWTYSLKVVIRLFDAPHCLFSSLAGVAVWCTKQTQYVSTHQILMHIDNDT